jgi:hypothetical protein
MDKTEWKLQYSESGSSALRNWMRLQSSARITRSRMMGLANRESSHVLWITIVLWPPSRISEVYSSIARLLSPTENQALVGIVYICTYFTLWEVMPWCLVDTKFWRNLMPPSSLQKTAARNLFYPEDGDSRLCKT